MVAPRASSITGTHCRLQVRKQGTNLNHKALFPGARFLGEVFISAELGHRKVLALGNQVSQKSLPDHIRKYEH